jgi:hypothetical protein
LVHIGKKNLAALLTTWISACIFCLNARPQKLQLKGLSGLPQASTTRITGKKWRRH